MVRWIANGLNPFVNLLTKHLFWYPTPITLNYYWSFGSLVGIFFALQIITGVLLAAHYTCHIDFSFASIDKIMVDVTHGYAFRYAHANGASMIFILMYLHIGKAFYYQSYITRPLLWLSGILIFVLMMGTAFIGYVLPWGQMSFWGATVITSLVTAVPWIGEDLAHWIWGGFSINNATLTRFFAVHYLLPFIIVGLIFVHLILLHVDGSSNPVGVENAQNNVKFHPFFTWKDLAALSWTLAFFCVLVFFYPNYLGHSDNFIPANPLVTPAHIVPEWYFTPFYAILRACPNKLGGAISMLSAILILFLLPLLHWVLNRYKITLSPYSTFHQVAFFSFVFIFFTLMFLGSNAASAPFIVLSKIFTCAYFFYFVLIIPITIYIDTRDNGERKKKSRRRGAVTPANMALLELPGSADKSMTSTKN